MKSSILAIGLLGTASTLFGGSVTLSDVNFSFTLNGEAVAAGLYEVRWGTYSSGVFTPFFGDADFTSNGAYMDTGTPELLATFSASNNTVVIEESFLALSLSLLPDDSNYSLATSLNSVVVVDPVWIAPTFTLLGPDQTFNFSSNTSVALLNGQNPATSFSFNGGNEVINLVTSAIPEPSSFAAFAGLGMLGFAAMRKRRRA